MTKKEKERKKNKEGAGSRLPAGVWGRAPESWLLTCGFPDISVDDENGTKKIGTLLAAEIYGGLSVLLTGPLGSGKTTLVSAAAGALGIKSIKSPTFTTMSVHSITAREFNLVHADLYRLDSGQIGLDTELQFEEYLSECRAVLFVEWGERWDAPGTDCWKIDISSPDSSNSDARRFGFRSFGEDASRHLANAYGRMLDAAAEWRRHC
ncbi:MAG: tRNA (adenosine(37)-N6)-threonylcarbamoyltransferase complex ATPase subunit type 1 TsaE [Synergistaceae bacterium]|jgi:tRNA threonylcarbamoyl adenosine modification protein YjeE|nr:tRNA (adenosine(37)-N6)-threonylcarbamoyltransferase complex ATPase subunit type 1 TsaE [Synergistaceae bacterium]